MKESAQFTVSSKSFLDFDVPTYLDEHQLRERFKYFRAQKLLQKNPRDKGEKVISFKSQKNLHYSALYPRMTVTGTHTQSSSALKTIDESADPLILDQQKSNEVLLKNT